MIHNVKQCPLTLNTTRLCGMDPVDTAVEISRTGFSSMKPNAVILVNKNQVFDGIAASPLVHFPINAPVLFTDGNMLSRKTLDEIQRLAPKGYKGIQVILIGNISSNVAFELQNLGLSTYHIAGGNHYETACKIPAVKKEFENILIISGEDFSEGIAAAFWSAHHGDPILYVQKNSIPPCTLEAIRKMRNINAYVIGTTNTISKAVEDMLSQLDNITHIKRISGNDPSDISVNFAKYEDPETKFGWARNYREGHGFAFGTLNNPAEVIAGVILAHMGKHSPLLLIEEKSVPQSVADYLQSVKPLPPKDMPKPPFMHGFILGDTSQIAYNTQTKIEEIISIEHEMMNSMNDQHMEQMPDMSDNGHSNFADYGIPFMDFRYKSVSAAELFE